MFYKVPLTSEQIRGGLLFQVSDALSQAFTESAKQVREGGPRKEQQEMLILFENSSITPSFWESYGDEGIQDVLYFNGVAKEVIEAANIAIDFGETVENAPENCGIMSRMYRFVLV